MDDCSDGFEFRDVSGPRLWWWTIRAPLPVFNPGRFVAWAVVLGAAAAAGSAATLLGAPPGVAYGAAGALALLIAFLLRHPPGLPGPAYPSPPHPSGDRSPRTPVPPGGAAGAARPIPEADDDVAAVGGTRGGRKSGAPGSLSAPGRAV